MERSFTMSRAQVADSDQDSLRASIIAAAGSERGADSIMRSLERLGTDPTIDYFEMTEVVGNRRYGGAAPAAWRVRADRGIVEEPAAY